MPIHLWERDTRLRSALRALPRPNLESGVGLGWSVQDSLAAQTPF